MKKGLLKFKDNQNELNFKKLTMDDVEKIVKLINESGSKKRIKD